MHGPNDDSLESAFAKWSEAAKQLVEQSATPEAPAGDPPPVTLALTDLEISRARWVKHLIARGVYSDDERGAA